MSITRDPMQPGAPVHPGEMLREEFVLPYGLNDASVAVALCVPVEQVQQLPAEQVGITADMAYRLALYFRMSPISG